MGWNCWHRRMWRQGAVVVALSLGCGSSRMKLGSSSDAAQIPSPANVAEAGRPDEVSAKASDAAVVGNRDAPFAVPQDAGAIGPEVTMVASPDVPIAMAPDVVPTAPMDSPLVTPLDLAPLGQGLGQPCATPNECASGQCADGVCCDQGCNEPCLSCSLPSSRGTCVAVPSGIPPRSTDACRKTDPSTCGMDGTCDGQGGCRQYAKNTECESSRCEQGLLNAAALCDGQGHCVAGQMMTCAPYGCAPDGGSCRFTCTTDSDCLESFFCFVGNCGQDPGWQCMADDQCASGFCRQSFCCDSPCDDPCMACNIPKHRGTCMLVPDAGCAEHFDAGTTGQ